MQEFRYTSESREKAKSSEKREVPISDDIFSAIFYKKHRKKAEASIPMPYFG